MTNKCIVLDRDGVINFDSKEYIKSLDEFIFIPGSVQAIVQLTQAGYRIGIATNQSGIARGLYTEETLQSIHQHLMNTIHDAGGTIEAICYCPHLPVQRCACRKPQPGMLQQLSQKMGFSCNEVCYVGDRISDILVAERTGAQAIIIESSMTDYRTLAEYPKVPVYPSLLDFTRDFLCKT